MNSSQCRGHGNWQSGSEMHASLCFFVFVAFCLRFPRLACIPPPAQMAHQQMNELALKIQNDHALDASCFFLPNANGKIVIAHQGMWPTSCGCTQGGYGYIQEMYNWTLGKDQRITGASLVEPCLGQAAAPVTQK